MEKNQENFDGVIEKMALITDATQNLFPNGKTAIIFELPEKEFRDIQSNFREIDKEYTKFKLDISGVEVIFILENSFNEEPKEIEEPKKENFFKRIFKKLKK